MKNNYIPEVTHATEIFLLSPALPARRSPLEGGGKGGCVLRLCGHDRVTLLLDH